MGESNGPWGHLAEHDAETAALWERYRTLPEPGENPVLDAFCERKNISIQSLMKQGARLAEDEIICYPYERALKYRDMNTGQMWNSPDSTFPAMKIIHQGAEPTGSVLVVEGETDGARVSEFYDCDVAIMPAGAKNVTFPFVAQLDGYEIVMLGLDNDKAGNEGIAKWQGQIPHAVVVRPEGKGDWCETPDDSMPALATEPGEIEPGALMLVSAADLMLLEAPEIPSYFEGAILPVGGNMGIHGWAKALKSFLSMDMLACLATGRAWCGFNNLEEPVKVAILQYEIPWAYWKTRVEGMREQAEVQAVEGLFDENFFTYSPLVRPQLIAGNTQQEDVVLRNLTNAGIQVFLVDPIRRMAGAADLNSEKDVRGILGFFERLNDEGITTVFTHHDNKGGAAAGAAGSAESMTGSGAFAGDPDTLVHLTLPRGETWEESSLRNIGFLLRNAPSPGMKGMEIHDNGSLTYSDMPHGYAEETATAEGAVDDDGPSL